MQKKQIQKVALWSTVALIIPALGELFVDGWHWGIGEFVFAWVFFNLLGLSYTYVTERISNPRLRSIVGVAVVLFYAFIWVMLATG